MKLSILYPKQLLASKSGLLVGKYSKRLNCCCITSVSKKSKDFSFKQRKNKEDHECNKNSVLGFQRCEKRDDKLYINCTITETEQSFTIVLNYKTAKILEVEKDEIGETPLLYFYDQNSVLMGINSLSNWNYSHLETVCNQAVSCHNCNFDILNEDSIYFLFKSNIEEKMQVENDKNLSTLEFTSELWLKLFTIVPLFTTLLALLERIVKLSSFGTQLLFKIGLLRKLSPRNKNITNLLKSDIMCGLLFDTLLGLFFYTFVCNVNGTVNNYTFNMLMSSISYIGKEVQLIIKWLMGIPIGLKLNSPLNEFLGHFFLHHVQLWLEYIQMLLSTLHDKQEYFMHWPLFSSCFGLSLFVSFVSDVVSLLSFHIYCFYVYGARLYRLQFVGLMSLWRLFRGKKWNPLRYRVDTLQDPSEGENPRFFLGTLLFTIILFLLPTTALYYAIFAALRIGIMIVQNILTYTQMILSCFPWCTFTYRWFLPLTFPNSAQIKFLNPMDAKSLFPAEEYDNICCKPTNFTIHIQPHAYSWVINAAFTKLNPTQYQNFEVQSFFLALMTGKLLKWT